jgi:hypothetical protein
LLGIKIEGPKKRYTPPPKTCPHDHEIDALVYVYMFVKRACFFFGMERCATERNGK